MSRALPLCLFLLVAVSSAVSHCPTWFKKSANGSCECGDELGGQIRCDKENQRVSIAMNFCMTYDNISQELQMGYCGYLYTPNLTSYQESIRAFTTLPRRPKELNKACEDHHLQGLLCGQCENGHGVAINSLISQCTKCSSLFAAGVSVLLIMFPITIFFVLVITFRLNFASGKALGYVLFCQGYVVVAKIYSGFYYSMYDSMGTCGRFALHFSLSFSEVWWYFQTFIYIFKPLCFHEGMTSLQVVLLQYIYVIYPLLLIFVSWMCIELRSRNFRVAVYLWKPFHRCFVKMRRKWSVSDSIVHAYATFFFLSFWGLCFTSASLTFSTPVWNMNGTITSTVLVLDPTIRSLSSGHLPYVVTATVLLFFLGLCPTIFLCLYRSRIFTKCCLLGARTQLVVNTFVETFESCYKDGMNKTFDFRFLSSAPMWLILLIVPMGNLYTHNTFEWHVYIHASFGFSFLCLSGVIACIRPFKTLYMNFSLTFHFAIIGFLSGIVVIWLDGHIMNDRSLAIVFTSLATLPHILALSTLGYHMLGHIHLVRTKFRNMISAVFHRQPKGITESLPDRLQNSTLYRTLPNLP